MPSEQNVAWNSLSLHLMQSKDDEHKGRVAALPCSLCFAPPPSYVHHILQGRTPGRKVGHWLTIPLCYDCHQGHSGIHGDKALWKVYKKSEFDCLNETLRLIYG